MISKFRILVTDRNRRVRQYLAREMEALGYGIVEVESEEELWTFLAWGKEIDLIIFDPEITRRDPEEAVRRLQEARPELPVIIHTFGEDSAPGLLAKPWPYLVIKSGPSAQRLKAAVSNLLLSRFPEKS